MNPTRVRCVRCKQHLLKSEAYQDDDILVVCGDCVDLQKDTGLVRMAAYHNLAQHLHLKCPNEKNGCTEMLLPVAVSEHVNICPFRWFQCEFCEWLGCFEDLLKHCIGHPVSDSRNFPVGTEKTTHLLSEKGNWFILNTDRKKGVQFEMKYLGWNDKLFNWKFQICGEWTQVMPVYSYHASSTKLYNKTDIPNTIMNCRVTITEDEVRSKFKLCVPIEKLYCPICLDILVPPIYQCELGHSVCSSCCKQDTCSLCRQALNTFRNTTLEQLIENLCFVRKCPHYGCNYATNLVHLPVHQLVCDFRSFNCPIAHCKWNNPFYQITKHLNSQHSDIHLKQSRQVQISKTSESKINIFQANNNNFRVVTEVIDGYMRVSVQYIGNPSKASTYTYSIQLTNYDSGLVQSQMCVKWSCAPFTTLDDIFKDEESFLQLPLKNLGLLVTKARFKMAIDYAKVKT